MEDAQEFACDSLPVLRHLLLVKRPMERHDQLIAVLVDHESNELLDVVLDIEERARTSSEHTCVT